MAVDPLLLSLPPGVRGQGPGPHVHRRQGRHHQGKRRDRGTDKRFIRAVATGHV